MFLRAKTRNKDGNPDRNVSAVEAGVWGAGEPPSTVFYLGEINDSQQESWRQTLEVFDESRQQYTK